MHVLVWCFVLLSVFVHTHANTMSVCNPKQLEHRNRNYLDLSWQSAKEPYEKTETSDLIQKL